MTKEKREARKLAMQGLRMNGWSLEEIGVEYEITRERVRQIIQMPGTVKLRRERERDLTISKMVGEGDSTREIGKIFGWTRSHASVRVHELGLKARNPRIIFTAGEAKIIRDEYSGEYGEITALARDHKVGFHTMFRIVHGYVREDGATIDYYRRGR